MAMSMQTDTESSQDSWLSLNGFTEACAQGFSPAVTTASRCITNVSVREPCGFITCTGSAQIMWLVPPERTAGDQDTWMLL
jgi:hypothetical protein